MEKTDKTSPAHHITLLIHSVWSKVEEQGLLV